MFTWSWRLLWNNKNYFKFATLHTHAKGTPILYQLTLMIMYRYYLVNSNKMKLNTLTKFVHFCCICIEAYSPWIYYQKYVDCMLCEGNYAEACIFDAHSTLPPQWYWLSHFLYIITMKTTISYPYLIVVSIGSFILSIVASRSCNAAATNSGYEI